MSRRDVLAEGAAEDTVEEVTAAVAEVEAATGTDAAVTATGDETIINEEDTKNTSRR